MSDWPRMTGGGTTSRRHYETEQPPMGSIALSAIGQDAAALAANAITAHEEAGRVYADFCGREMELEADRAGKKADAIRRIMAVENDLTGVRHSASSAEKVVELDHEYRAHLALQSEVVVGKNLALTAMHSARLRASLAIAVFKSEAGLTP